MLNERFERSITMRPAFDRRDPDPKKSYGVHGVEIRMLLKGPKGATQFVIFTNWQLPHVQAEQTARKHHPYCPNEPLAADVGYHSPVPRYKGQLRQDHCDLLPGGYCYYDGSGIWAQEVFEKLVEKGDEAVWAELMEAYEQWLEPVVENEVTSC